MSARALLAVFDSVYVVALTAWVGSVLFVSFGVAPIVFTVLGTEAGGKFVRALFPRYYLWGVIAGSVALPAFVAGPLCFPEFRGPRVGVQAAARPQVWLPFSPCFILLADTSRPVAAD